MGEHGYRVSIRRRRVHALAWRSKWAIVGRFFPQLTSFLQGRGPIGETAATGYDISGGSEADCDAGLCGEACVRVYGDVWERDMNAFVKVFNSPTGYGEERKGMSLMGASAASVGMGWDSNSHL